MAIAARALADGQLAAAEATLYTVPGATVTYIKNIICHNTDATNTNTVYLYVRNDGANSRLMCAVPLAPGEQLYFTEVLTLEAADLVRGYATNVNEVDYVINGAEEA